MIESPLTADTGAQLPVIGGAMYPCSNPELVAAVSRAGGIGIVQPISLTFVYRHDFREGLRLIRTLTDRPIGMNALIEASSRSYRRRMEEWVDVALEEGVRFFVTSLGKPRWVVDRVAAAGGIVYHDVTDMRWGLKALDSGVHGFIRRQPQRWRPRRDDFSRGAPCGTRRPRPPSGVRGRRRSARRLRRCATDGVMPEYRSARD